MLNRSNGRRLALAAVFLLSAFLPPGVAPAQTPPAPLPMVVVAPVVAKDVAQTWEFSGRVEPLQAVDVRARVQGFLQERKFEEGQDVTAGQLLFVIEPAPFEAALDAEKAQLSRAQATLRNAEQSLARYEELRGRGVESQANLDQATAQRDTAAADVAAAQANVKTAEINLGYTRITSPIDGRIGHAAITEGNLVGPDSGPLARIVQLDPIRVVFAIDDRSLVTVKQRTEATQEELNSRFVPSLRLSNGTEYPQKGKIDFVDNQVDPSTGTVAVRALFENPQRLLLPNQYVTVLVRPEQTEERPVVPMTAVQQDRQGQYVLVLDSQNRVVERRIETSFALGQDWVVKDGLREGETIVVEGVQKVQPGIEVKPVPASQQARR